MSLLLSGLVPYLAKLGLGTHCAYQLLWSYWGCVNLDTLTLGSRMLRSNGYFPECDQQLTTSQLRPPGLRILGGGSGLRDTGHARS